MTNFRNKLTVNLFDEKMTEEQAEQYCNLLLTEDVRLHREAFKYAQETEDNLLLGYCYSRGVT